MEAKQKSIVPNRLRSHRSLAVSQIARLIGGEAKHQQCTPTLAARRSLGGGTLSAVGGINAAEQLPNRLLVQQSSETIWDDTVSTTDQSPLVSGARKKRRRSWGRLGVARFRQPARRLPVRDANQMRGQDDQGLTDPPAARSPHDARRGKRGEARVPPAVAVLVAIAL